MNPPTVPVYQVSFSLLMEHGVFRFSELMQRELNPGVRQEAASDWQPKQTGELQESARCDWEDKDGLLFIFDEWGLRVRPEWLRGAFKQQLKLQIKLKAPASDSENRRKRLYARDWFGWVRVKGCSESASTVQSDSSHHLSLPLMLDLRPGRHLATGDRSTRRQTARVTLWLSG